MSKKTRKNDDTVSFWANLGGDPEEKTLKARTVTRPVYDGIIDEVVDKEFLQPEVHYLTYSVAYQTKEMDEPRWIRCVDWEGEGHRLRRGDRAQFTGYFRRYSYIDNKTGDRKEGKNFIVTGIHTERIRIRHQAA